MATLRRARPAANGRKNGTATAGARKPRVRPASDVAPAAIVASASRAEAVAKRGGSSKAQQWQIDSLAYYDQIGAVRYAAQFWARALSKIRWYVGEIDEAGEVTETTDERAKGLLDRVQDPHGGRSVLTTTYGQLRFLTGESYLIWTQPSAADGEQWEVVSMLELRKQSRRGGRDVYSRIAAPGLTPQELVEADDDDFQPMGKDVVVYRLWRRHPAYSMMADAPMRSVIADCEEIVRTTQTINARLISRLSGPGILAIPQSWTLPRSMVEEGDKDNPEGDPIFAELQKAMMSAISTPGSAESVVPIVVRVPDEQMTDAKAQVIKIWTSDEVIREVELREKALRRFAIGVDMPPERVMGMGDANHWNAWMIDEEAWEHIAPVCQEFADDLTGVYLRPAAKAEGIANWDRLVVAYDAAEVVTNPDGFGDALKLYDARAVGKAYLREAGNATDDDAPTDEELAEMLLVATGTQVEVSGGQIVEAEQPDVTGGEPPTGEDTERDQPEQPDEAEQSGLSSAAYMVLGAAEVALEDVRARVGGHVRSHLQGRCEPCVQQVQHVRTSEVVAALGPDVLAEHSTLDLRKLADRAATSFVNAAVRWGVSEKQATALAEVIELHAVRTIFDARPTLPAGFVGRVRRLEAP